MTKPAPPVPPRLMGPLKRLLPERVYYRYLGRHEKGSMRLWRQLAAGLPTGSAVLDVGAYHGVYAVAAVEAGTDLRVWAFEPNRAEHPALDAACAANGIAIERAAVAEESGTVTFSVNGEASRIVADDEDRPTEGDVVAAIALDEWLPEPGLPVELMKVDVEGFEDGVFRGGSALMARCRPIVLCEVLTDEAGARVEASLPDDYRFFRIDEDRGPRPTDRLGRWAWRHKNHLLVPAEKASGLAL